MRLGSGFVLQQIVDFFLIWQNKNRQQSEPTSQFPASAVSNIRPCYHFCTLWVKIHWATPSMIKRSRQKKKKGNPESSGVGRQPFYDLWSSIQPPPSPFLKKENRGKCESQDSEAEEPPLLPCLWSPAAGPSRQNLMTWSLSSCVDLWRTIFDPYPFSPICRQISNGLFSASVTMYSHPLSDRSSSAAGRILSITLRPFSPPAQDAAIPSQATSSSGVGT